jgi:hypothetical protein
VPNYISSESEAFDTGVLPRLVGEKNTILIGIKGFGDLEILFQTS